MILSSSPPLSSTPTSLVTCPPLPLLLSRPPPASALAPVPPHSSAPSKTKPPPPRTRTRRVLPRPPLSPPPPPGSLRPAAPVARAPPAHPPEPRASNRWCLGSSGTPRPSLVAESSRRLVPQLVLPAPPPPLTHPLATSDARTSACFTPRRYSRPAASAAWYVATRTSDLRWTSVLARLSILAGIFSAAMSPATSRSIASASHPNLVAMIRRSSWLYGAQY